MKTNEYSEFDQLILDAYQLGVAQAGKPKFNSRPRKATEGLRIKLRCMLVALEEDAKDAAVRETSA